MHPPSFRQLLVASTLIFFCLFLYGRRLWSANTSEVHDEWAKPDVPPTPPQAADSRPVADSSSPGDGQPAQKTALQQVPFHWNTYPL